MCGFALDLYVKDSELRLQELKNKGKVWLANPKSVCGRLRDLFITNSTVHKVGRN